MTRACSEAKKANSAKKIFDTFKEIHGEKYDYSEARYVDCRTPIKILCRAHGEYFLQKPLYHGRKKDPCGCPRCAKERLSDRWRLTVKQVEEKSSKIHGESYSYAKLTVENGTVDTQSQQTVTCLKCGQDFRTVLSRHLKPSQANGCPHCAQQKRIESLRLSQSEFVVQSDAVHKGKYDYSKVAYENHSTKVEIVCRKCRESFLQTPHDHKNGMHGCPSCNTPGSGLEDRIAKMLDDLGVRYTRRARGVLSNKRLELDFFIEESRVAIECHGNYWHSEWNEEMSADKVRYHMKNKFDECLAAGVKLIQFYEDEIVNKPEIVFEMIRHRLGLGVRIHGRKTESVYLSEADCRLVRDEINCFMDKHHIQGRCAFKEAQILMKDGEMVAAMLFNGVTSKRGEPADPLKVELVRLAFSAAIPGGASKLLKGFISARPTPIDSIVSYSDNRFGNGAVYKSLGFTKTRDVDPDYAYIERRAPGNLRRIHKSMMRRSAQARKFGDNFDPALTEVQNARNNGFRRIYNAGLQKWEISV